eukprot:SAG31_NODE_14775_length_788_cov_0.931785_1_plen_32_part_10
MFYGFEIEEEWGVYGTTAFGGSGMEAAGEKMR